VDQLRWIRFRATRAGAREGPPKRQERAVGPTVTFKSNLRDLFPAPGGAPSLSSPVTAPLASVLLRARDRPRGHRQGAQGANRRNRIRIASARLIGRRRRAAYSLPASPRPRSYPTRALLTHVFDEARAVLDGHDERRLYFFRRVRGCVTRGDAFEGLALCRGHRRRADDRRGDVALSEDAFLDRSLDLRAVHGFRCRGARRGRGRAAGAQERRAGQRRGREEDTARSSRGTGDACCRSWGVDLHGRILTIRPTARSCATRRTARQTETMGASTRSNVGPRRLQAGARHA
jgi:hypothetical protein